MLESFKKLIKNIRVNRKVWLVAAVFILACVLRFTSLDKYPVGFTQDEAAIGYDAYSLLMTGKDMWGDPFPLVLRSFGDFKMPLYSYMAIPSIWVFGLNHFSVRFLGALMGSLSVLATYYLVKTVFKRFDLAITSSLFLAISPWHISLSRGAFEANLTTFFIPLGIIGFIKGLKDPKWMIVSSFAFGLNLFSYHSARIFTPIIFVIAAIVYVRSKDGFGGITKHTLSRYKYVLITFSVFVFAALYSMTSGANTRGVDVTIFNPTDNWVYVAERRYEAVLSGFPDKLARIFNNKVVYVFDTFVGNYATYLSPTFLFTEGVRDWGYGMIPGRGVLYLFEAITVIVGIITLILVNTKTSKLRLMKQGDLSIRQGMNMILMWIILSPIPASLSKGGGFTGNRVATMMPAIQILSAIGFVVIVDYLGKLYPRKSLSKIIIAGSLTLLGAFLLVFLEDYVYHAPRRGAVSMQHGRQQMVEFVEDIEINYDTIVVSRRLSVPHIWFAFYSQWNPRDVQEKSSDWLEYERQGLVSIDQLGEYSFGKYLFGSIEQDLAIRGNLLIGIPEDFANIDIAPIRIFSYPNGQEAVYIVDPKTYDFAGKI